MLLFRIYIGKKFKENKHTFKICDENSHMDMSLKMDESSDELIMILALAIITRNKTRKLM